MSIIITLDGAVCPKPDDKICQRKFLTIYITQDFLVIIKAIKKLNIKIDCILDKNQPEIHIQDGRAMSTER